MTLTALIEDIMDEAWKSDKKAEGGSALYGGKTDRKGKGRPKSDYKGKSKGKLYKNCKNPNAYHDPEDCFVTNRKLRKE